jgi:hypothetical protein
VPDGAWEAVGRDAHAVIDAAKAAGVYIFGGGIDETVPPALVSADGTAAEGGYPWAPPLDGGFTVLELPRATRPSRGPRGSRKPVAAPRSCSSSGSTRSRKGSTAIAQAVRSNTPFTPTPLRGAASFGRFGYQRKRCLPALKPQR